MKTQLKLAMSYTTVNGGCYIYSAERSTVYTPSPAEHNSSVQDWPDPILCHLPEISNHGIVTLSKGCIVEQDPQIRQHLLLLVPRKKFLLWKAPQPVRQWGSLASWECFQLKRGSKGPSTLSDQPAWRQGRPGCVRGHLNFKPNSGVLF